MKRAILILSAIVFCLLAALPAQAQEPMIGEIRMWASTLYIPPGWRATDGTNMNESLYPDLCYRLGTTYGSAPSGYCKLPDLRGRNAVGYHPSEPAFDALGETGGEQVHTLTVNELPAHNHNVGNTPLQVATGGNWARLGGTGVFATGNTGGDQAHNVLDPYQVVFYIIYVGGASATTPTPTLIATNTPGPTATSTATPTVTPTGTLTPTVTPEATTCGSSAFPSTGILDDFNRADGSPGGSWVSLVNSHTISANQLIGSSSIDSNVSRLGTLYGPDSEAYFTLSVLPDDLAQAGIIIRYEEGVSDGYQVLVVRDDTNGDYVNLNGAILPLDNLQAGDSFGVRGTGSLAEAYYKPVGGSWALLGGGNDPNWLDAGYIAVSNSGNVGGAPAIDDVGGGAYVPGSCGNNTYLPYVITSTLQSGNTLSVPEQVSFGQIITGGIVVSLLAVFALDFIFRLVYRR